MLFKAPVLRRFVPTANVASKYLRAVHNGANHDHHAGEKYGGVDRKMFVHLIEKTAPFVAKFFQPQVQKITATELHVRLPANKDLIGNPAVPCYHGGVVATMLDHCGGFCAWAALDDPFLRVNTVDLRVDYLLPALCEDLYFDAIVLNKSNKLIRTDIFCRDSENRVVASGRAVFNVYKVDHDLTGVLKKSMKTAASQPNKVIDVDAE